MNAVCDIDGRLTSTSDDRTKMILSKIIYIKSDHAATEYKSLYSANLKTENQQVFSKLNFICCGLHSLVYFPDAIQATVLVVEKTNLEVKLPLLNSHF